MHHTPDLRHVLEATPLGGRVWLRAGGTSMWPLLLDGDQLRVLRCAEADLAAGDIAVIVIGTSLVAHLVTQTAPLVTCSLTGEPDPPGLALGRVEALKRRGVRVSLGAFSRRLLLAGPPLAGLLKRSPSVRGAVRWLRNRGGQ